MNIDALTFGQIKEIKNLLGSGEVSQGVSPYKIGTAYLIRTVTHYYTGRLTAVSAQELILEDAAWIAETGRYHKAIADGELSEIEPIIGPCIIGRGAIIDAVEWPKHVALPRESK